MFMFFNLDINRDRQSDEGTASSWLNNPARLEGLIQNGNFNEKLKFDNFFERESNFLDNSDRLKRHGMIKIGAAPDLTLNCFGSKLLADHSLVLDLSFQMPTKTRTDEGGCHVVIKERRHWGLILQSGPAQSKFTLRWNCSVLIG